MLRMLVIAAGFLAITIALLALQPGTTPQRSFAPAPAADTAERHPPAPVVNQVQVSRAESGLDLLATLGRSSAAPAPQTDSADMATLSAGVLAGLAPAPATADAPDDLRDMTTGVLAALSAAQTPVATAKQPRALETLVAQALRQGQSDAYLHALLREAAAVGQFALSDAPSADRGRLDTATLLATLVQKSPPARDTALLPQALANGEGVEVRVVQRAGQTVHYNFYTVQKGDSLGAIAERFYGDARLFKTIFDANRAFLSNPDAIRPGQRLSVPALGAS